MCQQKGQGTGSQCLEERANARPGEESRGVNEDRQPLRETKWQTACKFRVQLAPGEYFPQEVRIL